MQLIKNLPFQPAAIPANGIASLSLPLGMTYERITLVLGGGAFTKAMITLIECKLNGKTFYKITGSRLDAINKFKGIFDAAGFLTIDFSEIRARDQIGQSIGAIPTAKGVSTFTIEVTIAGATTPTLESYSLLSGPRELTEKTAIAKLLPYVVSLAAAGEFDIAGLPYGRQGGSLVKRAMFFHANMTALLVKKNGLEIHRSLTAVNEFHQKEYQRVPQAGLYVADFVVGMDMDQALLTADANSMQWLPTVSGADTLNIYLDTLDVLGNL